MNIAVVMEGENELEKLLKEGFLVFREEAEKRGHRVDYWFLIDMARKPTFAILDVIDKYDFIMHSLHKNRVTKEFLNNIPKKIGAAHFPHDPYSVEDDIGMTPDHIPDIIFVCFKPHLRSIKERAQLASAKHIPCRWWKTDLIEKFPKKRNEKLIVVVDAWDLPQTPEEKPQWIPHKENPIPVADICGYFSNLGYEVAIKGVVKPRKFGGYTSSYLRTRGTVECMQEAAFTIDQGSGMAAEVFLAGCTPILVSPMDDEVVKLIPPRQKTIVNYYKRYMHCGSPRLEHFPMKGVVSYIPGLTKEFDTPNVLDKIKYMDREVVVKELNDFWSIDTGEPFYVTALREIENTV
jgi:hypothetical protein